MHEVEARWVQISTFKHNSSSTTNDYYDLMASQDPMASQVAFSSGDPGGKSESAVSGTFKSGSAIKEMRQGAMFLGILQAKKGSKTDFASCLVENGNIVYIYDKRFMANHFIAFWFWKEKECFWKSINCLIAAFETYCKYHFYGQIQQLKKY